MKQTRIFLLWALLIFAVTGLERGTNSAAATSAPQAQPLQQPAARVVDLKTSDGTLLKASFSAAARPGPGVLLFHQSNRTRKACDDVAAQLGGGWDQHAYHR